MDMTTEFVPTTTNLTVNQSQHPDYDGGEGVLLTLPEFIPVVLTYSLTFVIGTVGNSLVIFSISRNEQMKTITNTFLLSLASADLLLVVFCIPFKLYRYFIFSWPFGPVMCKLIHYIQDVSAICSVSTLTMMSLERYYAIVHPMKARYVCSVGRVRRVTLVIWILSFLFAVPTIYAMQHLTVGLNRKANWCVRWFDNHAVNVAYVGYMFTLILVLPVGIMSFAYFRICRELWFMTQIRCAMRSATELSSTPSHAKTSVNSTPSKWSTSEKMPVLKEVKFSETDSTKKQVIKMLLAVIIVFILCWGPILTENLLKVLHLTSPLNIPPIRYIRQTFFLMSYANSCVNPIVYGFMSRNFRKAFKRALCSCVRGRQYVRKMTFKKQSYLVEKSTSNGPRQFEIVSTDMLELTDNHDKSSSDEAVRV